MKKFFGKIVAFLKNLFTNLDAWIHEHVQPSIETLNRVKDLVNNPVTDVLTALIPGTFDDVAVAWLRTNLTKAIDGLGLSVDISNEPDFIKKIELLVRYLQSLSPEMQKGIYMRLSSLMAKSSGGTDEVKGHSIDLLTQLQYSKLKEAVEHSDLQPNKYTYGYTPKPPIWNAATMKYEGGE